MAPRVPASSAPFAQQARGNGARPLSFFQALGLRRRRKEQIVKFDAIGGSESLQSPDPTSESTRRRNSRNPYVKSAASGRSSPAIVAESLCAAAEDACEAAQEPAGTVDSAAEETTVEKPLWQALRSLNLAWVERLWTSFKAEILRASTAARAEHCAERSLLTMALHSGHALSAAQSVGTYNVSHCAPGSDSLDYLTLNDFLALARKQPTRQDAEGLKLLECLFLRADLQQTGMVKAKDLVTMLVLVCEEDKLSKLQTLFRIFDNDDDHCMQIDEIFDMYVSIKTYDISRHRCTVEADVTFKGELSLQEAKRLYELTVKHLYTDSECVIFEEFVQAFDACPYLLESLMPGSFSLQWVLGNQAVLKEPAPHDIFSNTRVKTLTNALRKGDEQLDMSRKLGLGKRIFENCLGLAPTPAAAEQKQGASQQAADKRSTAFESTPRRATSGAAALARGWKPGAARRTATVIAVPTPGSAGPGGKTSVQSQQSRPNGGSRKVVPRKTGSQATVASMSRSYLKAGSVSSRRTLGSETSIGEASAALSDEFLNPRASKVSVSDWPEEFNAENAAAACPSEQDDGENSSSGSLESGNCESLFSDRQGVNCQVAASLALIAEHSIAEAYQVENIPVHHPENALEVIRLLSGVSKKDLVDAHAAVVVMHDREFPCVCCGRSHELKCKRDKHGRRPRIFGDIA